MSTEALQPKDVIISAYDKNQLDGLAIDAAEGWQRRGTEGARFDWLLAEAFQLGFTCVNRGEAVQDHPPRQDWNITEESVEDMKDIYTKAAYELIPEFSVPSTSMARKKILREAAKLIVTMTELTPEAQA